ncbi:MAG TPA: hypothetical protein VML91_23165 [Burkholderiales bacterium]|nr:hypothetical protein [Burkholderiales bacterium]
MKRNLIAIALCTLGLASVAVAEPTLNAEENHIVKRNAPEATSYQADVQQAGGRTMGDEIVPFTQP